MDYRQLLKKYISLHASLRGETFTSSTDLDDAANGSGIVFSKRETAALQEIDAEVVADVYGAAP